MSNWTADWIQAGCTCIPLHRCNNSFTLCQLPLTYRRDSLSTVSAVRADGFVWFPAACHSITWNILRLPVHGTSSQMLSIFQRQMKPKLFCLAFHTGSSMYCNCTMFLSYRILLGVLVISCDFFLNFILM